MNRRDLIAGGMALTAATLLPKQIAIAAETEATAAELGTAIHKMLEEVYSQLWQDFTIYGNCFAERLEEFPFIKRIPPDEWPVNYERLTG